MYAIFKREFKTYFSSPLGYVFLAVFYVLAGLFFVLNNILSGTANMSGVFSSITIICIFLVPVLTMRLLSEDKKQKTDQLLLTSPVSLGNIVLGKFLAAFAIYAIGLSCTVVYAFVLAVFVNIEVWVIVGSLFGMLLLGASFIAIGMFISNLTENQLIAAVLSICVILGLYIVNSLNGVISNPILAALLSAISIYSRYINFSMGIFNMSDAIYYLSVAAIFGFLTVRVLEKRRWS
jgi:ABC-2 type transport system permease protein